MTSPRPTLETGSLDGSEEPTVLGASPTLPGGRKVRRAERKARRGSPDPASDPTVRQDRASGKRYGGSPLKGAVLVALAIVLFSLAPVLTSAFKRTPADRIGVSYTGGPISGSSFQRVVEPGTGYFFNGLFSHLYLYPAGVSTLVLPDTSEEAGILESSDVVFPSSDHVPVTVELTASFRLNRDLVQGFHESLGLEHEAHTTEGWDAMQRIVFRDALGGALQEALRTVDSQTLLTDPTIIASLETQVSEGVARRLLESTGERYFCAPDHQAGAPCAAPRVVIGSLELPTWADPNADQAQGD